MPIITEAAWSPEHKWLNVKRLVFIPLADDPISSVVATYSSTATPGDGTIPVIGEVNWDGGADGAAATIVYINETDDLGGDQSVTLARLKLGDTVQVYETTSRFAIWDITAPPTDEGAYYSMTVTPVDAGTQDIRSNRTLAMTLTIFPDAVIPQPPNILQVHMAQEWPWVLWRMFTDSTAVVPYRKGALPMSDIQLIEVE